VSDAQHGVWSEPDAKFPLSPMSRRTLLKTMGGGLFLAIAGGGLLEACGSSSSPTAETGTLTVLTAINPPALDPIKYNAAPQEEMYRQVVESLYQWTASKTIIPVLASAMPTVSSDRLTYTIPLRRGVKFQNGKTFDAADVVYSYKQIMLPSNASIWLPDLAKVRSITATDPNTVTLVLTEPFEPLLSAMALLPIVPSNVPYTPTVYERNLIGTGPFKFDSWEQGVAVNFSKFDGYWNKGLPKADKLTFRIVTSPATMVANLAAGTAQLIDSVPYPDISVLKSRGAVVDVLEDSSVLVYMYPNLQAGKWTANVNARLAVAWAMNRQEILSQVCEGIGVSESTLPMFGAQYYDRTVGDFFGSTPDIAKAKQYVSAAGGPPSAPLEIVVLADSITTPTAPIVQQNLEAIGVPSKIISLATTPALNRLFAQSYDLFLIDVTAQQSSGFGSYIAYLGAYPGAFANFNKVNDPTLTELLSKAVTETTPDGKKAAWKAVQEAWVQKVPQIQLVTSHQVEATSRSLHGYTPTGLCQLYNLKYAYVS
jgi:peptide/nickel transport system substrate-binding protein